MGVPKRLTDQQQRFSELYVYNEGRMTPYECAKEAGYAAESARVRASELRNPRRYPLVVKFIGELREEVQNKYEVTFEKHIKELARLREEALKKGSFSSAVNAEVARGKAGGLYIEQKIIKTGPKNVTTGMCPEFKTIGRIFIIGSVGNERAKCPACNQIFDL